MLHRRWKKYKKGKGRHQLALGRVGTAAQAPHLPQYSAGSWLLLWPVPAFWCFPRPRGPGDSCSCPDEYQNDANPVR